MSARLVLVGDVQLVGVVIVPAPAAHAAACGDDLVDRVVEAPLAEFALDRGRDAPRHEPEAKGDQEGEDDEHLDAGGARAGGSHRADGDEQNGEQAYGGGELAALLDGDLRELGRRHGSNYAGCGAVRRVGRGR